MYKYEDYFLGFQKPTILKTITEFQFDIQTNGFQSHCGRYSKKNYF